MSNNARASLRTGDLVYAFAGTAYYTWKISHGQTGENSTYLVVETWLYRDTAWCGVKVLSARGEFLTFNIKASDKYQSVIPVSCINCGYVDLSRAVYSSNQNKFECQFNIEIILDSSKSDYT